VVNASIKSGTNIVHGNLWEYFRNYALTHGITSRSRFRSTGRTSLAQLSDSLSFRNKLFFFGDTEANRIVQGNPTTFTVPTALERQGISPSFSILRSMTPGFRFSCTSRDRSEDRAGRASSLQWSKQRLLPGANQCGGAEDLEHVSVAQLE
jgi:hypothetical protein